MKTRADSALTTLFYLKSVLLVDANSETKLYQNELIDKFNTSLRILPSDVLQKRGLTERVLLWQYQVLVEDLVAQEVDFVVFPMLTLMKKLCFI